MIIHVGSQNPVKLQAVQEVAKDYSFWGGATIIGMSVLSDVPEQPLTLDDTIHGAEKRALRAFPRSTYSIGLESGAHEISVSGRPRYMELTACAVYDGNRMHLGYSSAFEIPPPVMKFLKEGMDLEQACLHAGLTTNPDLGKSGGIIGILSHNRLLRKEYTKQALVTALFGLQNPSLYL